MSAGNGMMVKVFADGGMLLTPGKEDAALTPADFAEKKQVVSVEPAFYVALGEDGLMKRSVLVAAEDRKVVAALVGNWIAEGFIPTPCDLKTYTKHVRNLAAAHKPVKVEEQKSEVPGSQPPADNQDPI